MHDFTSLYLYMRVAAAYYCRCCHFHPRDCLLACLPNFQSCIILPTIPISVTVHLSI